MSDTQLLVCNCQNTMTIDGDALGSALGHESGLPISSELCRSQCATFEAALTDGRPVRVACTQEAPLFAEIAEEADAAGRVSFVNIRERAGWCDTPANAVPKMAALLADSSYPNVPAGLTTLQSDGVCLVLARDQAGVDAAVKLADHLSVTLVLTPDADDVMLPRQALFAIHRGQVRSAVGHLGAFEVTADGFCDLLPSSRRSLDFTMPRNGATSNCDVIVDLTGGTPLFAETARRDGYVRADPGSAPALAQSIMDAADLIGDFEKPIYVGLDAAICAHARSGKVGCSNCLDLCPTGAIQPDGDHVAISAAICAGCGSCAAACPTGAITYSYPQFGDLVARLQIMAGAYAGAGGAAPRLLLHDLAHGDELIAALARYGHGLPADVIPVGLHAVFQAGHALFLAALASGFQEVVCLTSPETAHERPAFETQVVLTAALVRGIGIGGDRVRIIETAD
ncbi:MAG: 4Fe-4S binding protein, partial [Pseudomonadota bacterium]